MKKGNKALLILGCIAAGAIVGGGSGFLLGHFLKPTVVDMTNVDASQFEDNDDMISKYEKCKADGKDPVEEFSIAQLANLGTQKFMAHENLVAWGYGEADTAVKLDIRNLLIKNGNEFMEESLSKSVPGAIMNVEIAQRDYQHGTSDNEFTDSYVGHLDAKDVANYTDYTYKQYTNAEFEDLFGKAVDNPSCYVVSDKTVLTPEKGDGSSYIKKTETGYEIMLDLDTVKGVARYYKRMVNLSHSQVNKFFYVHVTHTLDDDFNLIKTSIDESYHAGMGTIGASVHGTFETYYFVDTEGFNIPELNVNIKFPERGALYA